MRPTHLCDDTEHAQCEILAHAQTKSVHVGPCPDAPTPGLAPKSSSFSSFSLPS